jgi:hypothetical protein
MCCCFSLLYCTLLSFNLCSSWHFQIKLIWFDLSNVHVVQDHFKTGYLHFMDILCFINLHNLMHFSIFCIQIQVIFLHPFFVMYINRYLDFIYENEIHYASELQPVLKWSWTTWTLDKSNQINFIWKCQLEHRLNESNVQYNKEKQQHMNRNNNEKCNIDG